MPRRFWVAAVAACLLIVPAACRQVDEAQILRTAEESARAAAQAEMDATREAIGAAENEHAHILLEMKEDGTGKQVCGVGFVTETFTARKGTAQRPGRALWFVHNECSGLPQVVTINFTGTNPLQNAPAARVPANQMRPMVGRVNPAVADGDYQYEVWIGGTRAIDPEIKIRS